MARYYGAIGYGLSEEDPVGSGVWKDKIVESSYYGDILRNTRRMSDGESVNGRLSVNNSISIVADAYAIGHFHLIKYAVWEGNYWTVSSVEVKHPRLILSLGEIYNGPTARTTSSS